jgi:hypothetical protein
LKSLSSCPGRAHDLANGRSGCQGNVDRSLALEDRKLIERAKGIVMHRLRLDEAEAFRRLKRFASDNNRKLAEVARNVVSSDEIYRELERQDSRNGAQVEI